MTTPNKLLLGLLNLAVNCKGNLHSSYSQDKILTSVGAVFRFRLQAGVSEHDLERAIKSIHRVSVEDLGEVEMKEIEKTLSLPLPNDSLELVMCKRAERGKDYNQGQLCLPGGHVDPGENEDQACVREIKEEIGYDVADESKFVSLGKLFEGLHAFYIKGKQTTISIHVFIQITFDDIPLATDPSEITDAYWIGFADFWTYNLNRILLNTLTKEGSESILKSYTNLPHKYIDDAMESDDSFRLKIWGFQLPKIKSFFWGLTLSVVTIIVEAFAFGRGSSILDFEDTLKAKLFITRPNTGGIQSTNKHFEAMVNHQLGMNQNTIAFGFVREKL